MKRKLLATILTTALLASMTGCAKTDAESKAPEPSLSEEASSEESPSEEASSEEPQEEAPSPLLPYTGDEITFNYFWFELGSDYSDETLPIVQAFQEKIGNVSLNLEILSLTDYWTAVPLRLASGEVPDLMIIGEVSSNLATYGQNGIFLDWAPLMEEYMPNLYAYSQKISMFDSLKDEEGHMYALPLTVNTEDYIMQNWIANTTLLEELDIEIPTTQEEFLEACRKVKNETDVTPIQQRWGLIQLMDSIGLMYEHEGDRQLRYYADEGKWDFGPTREDSELKSYLTFMHTLWEEELIDHEIDLMSDEQFSDNIYSGNFAFTHDYQSGYSHARNSNDTPFTEVSDFEIKIIPTPRGTGAKISIDSSMDGKCVWAAVSNVNTEHPELLAACIDAIFSEEIATCENYGILGTSYDVTADGEKYFTDNIKAASNNYAGEISLVDLGADRSAWLRTFGINDVNSQRLREESPEIYAGVNEIYALLDAGELEPRYGLVLPSMTGEENEEISSIQAPVQTYLDECIMKFIRGDMDLDKDWDTFMTQLQGYGDMNRVCEIYNSKEMPQYKGNWR